MQYAAPKVPPEGKKKVQRKAKAPAPSEKKKSLIRKNAQLRFDAEQLTFQWQEKLFAKRVASRETLIQSARYLQPEHYREVIEERNLEAWCGYPLCGNDKAEVSSRYRISLASRKVFDQSALAQFCSKECLTKSRFLEAQLSEEPVWTRNIIRPSKEQDPDVTVVGMQEKIDDYMIEEASAPPTKQRVREQYIHQLLSQLPPPIADITIHERTPQTKSPIPPSQDIIVPTAASSEKIEADAIEGFRVSFDSRGRQDRASTLVLPTTEKPNKHGKSSGQRDTSFTSLAIADDDILQDAMNTMMQLRLQGEHIPQSDLNEQRTSVEKQQPPAEPPKVVKQHTTPPSTTKTEVRKPPTKSQGFPSQPIASTSTAQTSSVPSTRTPSETALTTSVSEPRPAISSPSSGKTNMSVAPPPISSTSSTDITQQLQQEVNEAKSKKKATKYQPTMSTFGRLFTLLDRMMTPETKRYMRSLQEGDLGYVGPNDQADNVHVDKEADEAMVVRRQFFGERMRETLDMICLQVGLSSDALIPCEGLFQTLAVPSSTQFLAPGPLRWSLALVLVQGILTHTEFQKVKQEAWQERN